MKLIGNTKIRFITNMIQHYNPNKYFTMRSKVLDTTYKSTILKLWYLYRIKKMDAFNNASFGTNFNSGAFFKTPPILPHGLNGIIIGHDCDYIKLCASMCALGWPHNMPISWWGACYLAAVPSGPPRPGSLAPTGSTSLMHSCLLLGVCLLRRAIRLPCARPEAHVGDVGPVQLVHVAVH